eukprot:SAG11_NODE_10300_length_841_cov_1.256065_1_plen_78_part_10
MQDLPGAKDDEFLIDHLFCTVPVLIDTKCFCSIRKFTSAYKQKTIIKCNPAVLNSNLHINCKPKIVQYSGRLHGSGTA